MPEPRTITEAAEFIRRGELTPIELLEECLARIDRYEPKVRAWVLVDRDGAREQAERLTAELKAGQNRGPLHGIPIGIKDIIDVFDLPTACGSKLWANSIARKDATVVQRLRQAGAIIMGKTVTTAFASFDPPVTRNPWNLERTPGGSSSGSAAAVACGMCLGALATQTGGSITRPAAYCGVCSIKPTYGRVSLDGVLPLAPSMDHMGCMANCVRDVAIIYQTIAGPDPAPATGFNLCMPVEDCLEDLGTVKDHLRRKPMKPDLAAFGGMFESLAEPTMIAPYRALLEKLHDHGAWVTNVATPAGFAEVTKQHRIIMAVEAAQYHEARFQRHPGDYPPRISQLIVEGLKYPAVEYVAARHHRYELGEQVDAAINGIRFLLCPATKGAAPLADSTGDPVFNSPWSFTGSPTVSVPFSRTPDGMPLALQIVADDWEEANLLSAAAFCESVIGYERREPPL